MCKTNLVAITLVISLRRLFTEMKMTLPAWTPNSFLSARKGKPCASSDHFLSPPPVIKSNLSLPTPAHPKKPTYTKLQIQKDFKKNSKKISKNNFQK